MPCRGSRHGSAANQGCEHGRYFRSVETLIGLGHQMRSGKDTAAEILVKERCFTRFAFADILREYAYRINPVVLLSPADVECLPSGSHKERCVAVLKYELPVRGPAIFLADVVDMVGWEQAKSVQGVRRTLQDLGHHGREMIGPNVWVDALFSAVAASGAERVVISDVRYDNEADRIRSEGGVTAHVRRDVQGGDSETSGHPSEHGLSDGWADCDLDNNGSREELRQKVLSLADSLFANGAPLSDLAGSAVR